MAGSPAISKKALEDEKRVMTWCLAWKNVKAGTKYNKLVRCASLGKVNEKGKTEKFRWTALYSNCIVEYSIKTEPKEDDLTQAPKKWHRLEKCSVDSVQRMLASETRWQFTAADGKVVSFDCANREEAHEWMFAVKKAITTYNEAIKEVLSISDPMPQVQAIFVQPNWVPPAFASNTEEAITGWISKIKELKEKHKMWHSFLLKLRTFADLVYSHGPYTDWFYGEGKDESIDKKITRACRDALKTLARQGQECYKECKVAFEQSFFREDLEPAITRGKFGIMTVDNYNVLKKEVLHDLDSEEHLDIKAVMKAFVELFSKLPKANEVNFHKYDGGMLVHGKDKWMADHSHKELPKDLKVWCKNKPDLPFFVARGFETVSERHGSVIWNNVSWVWFHPRLRFTIRYNWRFNERTFEFHSGDEGKWIPGQTLLPDWCWTGSSLDPVYTNPLAKKAGFMPVDVKGAVPVPTALFLALMPHILFTVREQLGIVSAGDENVKVYLGGPKPATTGPVMPNPALMMANRQ